MKPAVFTVVVPYVVIVVVVILKRLLTVRTVRAVIVYTGVSIPVALYLSGAVIHRVPAAKPKARHERVVGV